ncbi:hypothetical protein [Pedobacter chitinilyticus]|uniref:Prepilin type IV endopeptidase peptidase domain-containing protein n=1 Tax=Pedobacter chitinilyticus TaxID=2233776 RepID=A0A3S3PI42_9SPHI|nr:hypothetical protein [Pedobacter chitinilyticus]RWU09967.1 hypothetical protein DPV69_01065 [Pedobacter chitinilyticus]
MLWILLLTVLLLLAMAWQDFKYRAISIWLFIAVAAGLVYLKYQAAGRQALWTDLLTNLCFLTLQMGVLFGYFALKHRKWVNLFKGYLGEGDLLFLVLLATYLSFFNFVAFHVSSLFLVLLLGIYLRHKNPKIPLAGAQAFCLAVLMLADYFIYKIDLTQDFWLLSFFNS